MSTVTLERSTPATWHLAVASFLAPEKRARSERWIARMPLGLVLLVQTVLTVRLSNSAYRDEGLYIWTGHRMIQHWLHGAVLYDQPSTYFSGSPGVYPPIAAMLDFAGGLVAVRAFSLVCMLVATLAVHSTARRLFAPRAGLAAAFAFVLAGSTQQLGHFATFDAMSLMLLAVACSVGVWAVQTRKLEWSLAVGLLLAVAVSAKYVALLFVPVVLGVLFLATPHRQLVHRRFAQYFAVCSFFLFAVTIAVLVRTIGRADFEGFRSTTSQRDGSSLVQPATVLDVLHKAVSVAGVWYLLAAVGVVVAMVRLRRYVLPLVLAVGAVAPVAYQAYIGEAVSLEKHIDFGLVFGAPLIGVLLLSVKQLWRKLIALLAIVVMIITGVATSQHIFSSWSNTSALTDTLRFKFAAAPYLRTLGEPYEPIRYAFADSTKYWQWDTTDPIDALYYQPPTGPALRGIAAAKAGLAADYWQVVYFDGSTGASQELEPLLPGFGYKLTDTVPLTNNRGQDVYRIWQRFS